MKKIIIILGLLGLTIFAGLYVKRKLYDPQHRLDNAKNEVKQLVANDEIKNGDIIFIPRFQNKAKPFNLRQIQNTLIVELFTTTTEYITFLKQFNR